MRRGLLGVFAIAALAGLWWVISSDATRPGTDEVPLHARPTDATRGASGGEATARSADGVPTLEAQGQHNPTHASLNTSAEPAPPADGAVVTGRVIDERRRPVAGAMVTVFASYTTGSEPLAGTTDAQGHYEIPGLARPSTWGSIVLSARHGSLAAQAGVSTHEAMPSNVEVRLLVLGPAHAIDVRARHEDGTAAAGARILVASSSTWATAVVADLRADTSGSARIEGLGAGRYRVHAALRGYGRGTTELSLPQREPGPILVAVGPERPLAAVVIDKATGAPIQGARILVDELIHVPTVRILPWAPLPPGLVTNRQGRVTIAGLGLTDAVQINAEAKGYSGRGHRRVLRGIPVSDTEVRIELQTNRQVRWPLAADNPHAPPEGRVLELAQPAGAMTAPLPSSARIEDGHVVAEGCHAGLFHLIVEAPSGAFAQVMALPAGGQVYEATFHKPRQVIVVLKQADGTPAAGYHVSVRGQGNHVLVDPVRLGPDGRAVLAVRSQRLINVFASRSSAPYAGASIGSLDLKDGGGTVAGVLPGGRRVELRILIDGEARLPGRYTLGFVGSGAADVQEDPATGTLRFGVPRSATGATKFTFNATGFLPHALKLPAAEGTTPVRLEVVLSRGGSVLLRIKPPSDGDHNVQVNKIGVQTRGFRIPQPGDRATELRMEDGWLVRRHGPLAPGAYEAGDSLSKARSKVFTVAAGQEAVVELDLSHVGNVNGRVTVPEGYDFQGARVTRVEQGERPNPSYWFAGAPVRKDGTFTLRVPGDRMITVAVTHPLLTPASPGGRADVKAPGDDLLLKLVAGGSARFMLEPMPTPTRRGRRSAVNVYLYEKPPTALPFRPTHSLNARRAGEFFSVEGFKPGTYTVVVDMQGRAPALLGRQELGVGTDLGTVTTAAGATIRFRLQVKEGQDPPRIFAYAVARGGISYRRGVNSGGDAEVLLTGLGRGTFDVQAHSMQARVGGAAGRIKQTVESDGESEIVIEMDLR